MNSTTDFNKLNGNHTNNEEIRKYLEFVIEPKYKHHISDWIYNAKPNEKKGLYILNKVIKYKGQKIFKTQLVQTKEEQYDISKLTLEEAFKRYQKRKVISSYSEFYGVNLDDKFKYNNILKYKDFINLNYSEIINKDSVIYIQAWLNNEKTEQYKEYVLDFLRSFISTVRSNRKFVTHNSEQLPNFKSTDKFTAHAPYVNNTSIRLSERVPTVEELRARLKLDSYKVPSTTHKNDDNENKYENKKTHLRSNGNFLKGIYNNTCSTAYQDSFKGLSAKYSHSYKIDTHSSAIKGISPDEFTMNRITSAIDVNDSLKNTVKSIMFDDNFNRYK